MTYETAANSSKTTQIMSDDLLSFMKFSSPASSNTKCYLDADYSDLEKRYASVQTYVKQIATGMIHNLIVIGPAGVGKTHSVESYLNHMPKVATRLSKGT